MGTSSIKAAIIDNEGTLYSYGRVPLESFYQDNDPACSWSSALRSVLSQLAGIEKIEAICVTGNGPTLVPIDRDLNPVSSTISWITTPTKDLGEGKSLYLPRLMHALEHDPSLHGRTSWFVGCPEYVSALLTGEVVSFLPHKRFTPYIWDPEQLKSCGIALDKIPPFISFGERVGYVHAAAADHFMLSAGIPVFAGLIDFHAAMIGCGVVRPGMTCDRAGTSEGIDHLLKSEIHHQGLRTLPGPIDKTWTLAGLLPASGEVFEWYRMHAGMGTLSYKEITRSIMKSTTHHDYYFYPVADTHETLHDDFTGGVFTDGGVCSDIPERRGRAVAEGLGFSVRMMLEQMVDAGCKIDMIRHCGGQARSFHWNYMKAQILRIPIGVPRIIDAELLGCAMVSFCGLGLYPDVMTAADAMVHIERVYTPIQHAESFYESYFQEWKERRNTIDHHSLQERSY